MTRQETYDIVVAHLRQQGCKSLSAAKFNDEGKAQCAYRGAERRTCAAGCLIPNDEYRLRFEGNSVWDEEIQILIERELGHDIFLVADLQNVHDIDAVDHWEREFLRLAVKWELKYRAVGFLMQPSRFDSGINQLGRVT